MTAATTALGQEDCGCGATERRSPHLAKEREAVLEGDRDQQLEMPHDQAWAAAVEDDGAEEESNAGQRQRKEVQSMLDEQAAGGGLHREAQEEPQIDGDERANPQPGEEGEQQHEPEEERSSNEQNGDGGHGDKLSKLNKQWMLSSTCVFMIL